MSAAGPLASWRDGAAKEAVLAFVAAVDAAGVPAEERVAVFDNDGTLWCEHPLPAQVDFTLRHLAARAEADPALRAHEPFRSAHAGDLRWLGRAVARYYQGDDSDIRVLAAAVGETFAGMTVEAFEERAAAFTRTAANPLLGRPYAACAYAPMVELLAYLAAGGFTNWIVSGGGRDFVRPVSLELYGIRRERVIGSSAMLTYRPGEHGGTIVHEAAFEVIEDGLRKPVAIWSHAGRRPLLAAGNSNGDVPMLQFAESARWPSLRLLVRHDDAEREVADSAAAEAALAVAEAEGWTVVSMAADWARVFQAPAG